MALGPLQLHGLSGIGLLPPVYGVMYVGPLLAVVLVLAMLMLFASVGEFKNPFSI